MLIRYAFRNLFRNLRRTIAVLLTVAMGSGALFSFEGFINGVLQQYRESTIHAHYGHGQITTQGYRETVFEKPWMHWISNWKQLESSLLDIEGIDSVFPRVSFSALLTHGNKTISGQGQGVDAAKEVEFFSNLNVESGTMLVTEHNGILLGRGLAKALNVKPGDSVTVSTHSSDGAMNQAELIVTGIFHTGSQDFDNRIFRIQLNEAQRLLKTPSIELISLGLHETADWEKTASSIEATFPNLEAFSFAELDAVYYQHSVDWLQAQFRVVQLIILSIVLLGIFNTVSTSVLERKQEIGNLRANGESAYHVMKLILAEGAFLGWIGAVLGVVFSFIVLKVFLYNGIAMPPGPGMTRPFYAVFHFEWPMVLRALVQSILAAACASFLAGLKVVRMPIAKALYSI